MRVLKNIAGRIWATWGMISFIITFLIFFIPSMFTWVIPDPMGQKIFIGIARLWMNIWLRLVGCPVTVRGKEHFKPGETYIVTCNHNSLMDVPISSPFIPGANKTIAKSSFAGIPLFGFYYMKGAVLVNRKSEKSRRESFEKMRMVLQKKIHMCIYPEGTRNRTEEPLKKFHAGAFKLAVSNSNAIIPAIIFNSKKALPLHKTFFLWPQRLQLHFLEAVPVDGLTAEQLQEKIFNIMKDYYVQNRR
ncbi:MAG TPA: lysophospholipid acyltransferase family protein [Chitinophagaceae bacterium]